LAVDHLPNEKSLVLLRRHIVRNAHLLRQAQTLGEVEAVLLNDCSNIEDEGVLHEEWEREITGPYLTAWHPFPNPSSTALVRTLWGHILPVNGCAISADGSLIVSASDDTTLKVWEVQTGRESLTLQGHTAGVNGCAISADGRLIVSASSDKTLKVWDSYQGSSITTLYTDDRFTSCVWHPDGIHLVATGVQGVYFLQMIQ
jgi:WD40 repeat protein